MFGKKLFSIFAVFLFLSAAALSYAGPQATILLTVTIENTVISNVTDAPDAFSPNADSDYDTALISYELGIDADVSIIIYDQNNSQVRVLKNNVAENAGIQSAVWDGKDSTGAIVEDGTYIYEITANYGQSSSASVQGQITVDNKFLDLIQPKDNGIITIGSRLTFQAIPSEYISSESNVKLYYRPQGTQDWLDPNADFEQYADGSWVFVEESATGNDGDVVEVRICAQYLDLNGQARQEYTSPITLTFSNEFNIYNVHDSPDAFSPNGDGDFDAVSIAFSINRDSVASLRIYDSNNNLIRTLGDNVSVVPGDYETVWDGCDESANIQPEGVYIYRITADDGLGNIIEKEGSVVIDNHFMSISEPAAGTTLSGEVTFRAVTSENVFQESNVLFYAREKGELEWDIIDEANPPAKQPDGSWLQVVDTAQGALNTDYEIRVGADYYSFDNELRREYTLPIEFPIVNDLNISVTEAAPNAFSPNADGQYDSTEIEYRINAPASVTLKIYDQDNNLARVLQENVSMPMGNNLVSWDGRDDSSNLLPEGTYTFEVTAEDIQNNITDTAQGTVVIDNHFMRITEPAQGSNLTKDVTLAAAASVNTGNARDVVFSYKELASVAWTDISPAAQNQPDGSWTVDWNVDSLASGNYEIRVYANYDDINDDYRSEYSTSYAYIIPDYVKISNVSDAPDAFSPNNDGDFDENTLSYDISRDSAVSIRIYDVNDNLIRILKESVSEIAGTQTAVWDGRNDQGSVVSDGEYAYLIEAKDADNYQAQYQAGVTVNNNIAVFDPADGSGISGLAAIKIIPSSYVSISGVSFYYRLLGASNWNHIGNGTKQADDTWIINWDAVELENNDYEVYAGLGFFDLDNNSRHENTVPVTYTLTNIINIFNVADSPDAFSPNNDGNSDTATISYRIVNAAGNVAIKLYDASDNLVRTLKQGILEPIGDYQVIWDGKDDSGQTLQDGIYTYIIEADDGQGNTAQKQGTVTIDNHPLTVLPADESTVTGVVNISARPSQYCQDGAVVSFIVKHRELNVYSLYIGKGQQQLDGSWTTEWDTSEFIDGMYEFTSTLYYNDQDGNSRSDVVYSNYMVANGNLIVDVSDSPDPISPNDDNAYDKTLIKYTLGIESDVSIYILDEKSNDIRTLQNSKHLSAGYYYVFWDGKDDDGNTVADGNYTYAIHAVYETGHEEIEQGVISVDTQFASIVEPAPDSSLNGTITFKIQPSPYVASISSIGVYVGISKVGDAVEFPDNTWGVVWNTESMPDGNYNIKLQVAYLDSEGKTRCEVAPVSEYTIANNLQVSRNAFSPNDDGSYDTTTIYYNAALDGEVTVKIFDSNGTLVRVLQENVIISAGENSVAWDGKDNSEKVVSDGIYTYKIDINFVDSSIDYQEGTLTVDNHFLDITSPASGSTLSQSAILDISSSPFITNAALVVAYYRKLGASEWIRMANNVYSQGSGLWMTAWDTSVVSNGDYEICLSARYEDLNGFERNEFTMPKIYRVANDFAIIQVSDSPDAFSPNGNGEYELSTIVYFINRDATVSVAVYDSNNILVRTLEESIFKLAGENSVVWDGKDDFGSILEDGTYTYKITAEDSQGAVDEVQSTVSVDNHFMSITDPVPGQTISGEVRFKIEPSSFNSRAVYVQLNIMSLSQGFVCEKQIDGSFAVTIDTKTVVNGEHDFQIIASYYDQDLKGRSETSLLIRYTIFNETPEIFDLQALPNPFSPDSSGTWIDPDTGEVFNDPAPGLILDDITAISFRSSSYGVFNVNIYDQNDQLINRLVNNEVLYPDPQTQEIELTWDGSSMLWPLPNGRYYLVVDPGSVTEQKTLEIMVDKMPFITDSNVYPNPFLPGSDVNNQTNIKFKISENSYLNVAIIKDEETVRDLVVSEWSAPGDCSYIWDGTDNNGDIVAGGNYIIQISAVTEFGTKAEPVQMNVFVSNLTDLSVSQQALNPYLDETVDISYCLEEEKILSLKIYNDNNALVRTLLDNQTRQSGVNTETWDGKDDNGEILPDDVYCFVVEENAEDTQVQIYDPRGTDGLNISREILFSASNFNPKNNEFCVLSYEVPEPVYHTIRVRYGTYSGPVISVIKYEEPIAAGQHESYWNGRDETGDFVSYANYTFALWGYRVNSNSILIVGGRPKLSNMSVAPIDFNSYYNPYKANSVENQTSIGFDLSRDANVTIHIYNTSGDLVRILENDVVHLQGHNVVYWNGLADDGSMLKNGDYRIMIQARYKDNYSDVQTLHVSLVL